MGDIFRKGDLLLFKKKATDLDALVLYCKQHTRKKTKTGSERGGGCYSDFSYLIITCNKILPFSHFPYDNSRMFYYS